MFRTIGFRFSGTAVSPHKNIQYNVSNGLTTENRIKTRDILTVFLTIYSHNFFAQCLIKSKHKKLVKNPYLLGLK